MGSFSTKLGAELRLQSVDGPIGRLGDLARRRRHGQNVTRTGRRADPSDGHQTVPGDRRHASHDPGG